MRYSLLILLNLTLTLMYAVEDPNYSYKDQNENLFNLSDLDFNLNKFIKIRHERYLKNIGILELMTTNIKLKLLYIFSKSIDDSILTYILKTLCKSIYLILHLVIWSLVFLLNLIDYVLYLFIPISDIKEIYKPVYAQNKLIILANTLDFRNILYIWLISILLITIYLKYEKH